MVEGAQVLADGNEGLVGRGDLRGVADDVAVLVDDRLRLLGLHGVVPQLADDVGHRDLGALLQLGAEALDGGLDGRMAQQARCLGVDRGVGRLGLVGVPIGFAGAAALDVLGDERGLLLRQSIRLSGLAHGARVAAGSSTSRREESPIRGRRPEMKSPARWRGLGPEGSCPTVEI